MEQKYKTNAFKKLLDRLQEDSWQLELLISGFAILGLFYALDPITNKLLSAQFNNNGVFVNFFVIVLFSLQILIFNLVLHVLLRGLWIGSLGMRYVFGDIDYDKLNYSDQFRTYLKKNVGSFDSYIGKLEDFCSVVFAITFLLIFYVISFFIVGFTLLAFNIQTPDWMIGIVRFFFALFSIGVLLNFFDFITLGLLKKNKTIAKLFFPFYWGFSILSLSFLYRPLVYNLLDNKLGRRISIILIPFYILIYIGFHLEYQKSNFVTRDAMQASSANIANGRNYLDVIEKNKRIFIGDFAIQSKVITEPYLKLIVPLDRDLEDNLTDFNPSLQVQKDNRGLYFQPEIGISVNDKKQDVFNDTYLNTFEEKYQVSIDATVYHTDFVINELGFESYIGIENLADGKHTIELQCFTHKDDDSLISIRKIPFWYYKD